VTTQPKAPQKKSILGLLSEIGTKVGVLENVPDAPAAHGEAPPNEVSHSVALAHQAAGTDPQVAAKLEAKLQAAAPPVYITFMEQFTALADVIPDEATRIKAALKTSRPPCSIPQLVEALGQLGDAMAHAKDEFEASFQHTKTERLGQAEQSIAAIDESIKAHEASIKALQDELVTLHAQRDVAAQQMTAEMARLGGIRATFLATHAQVVERLTSQKNRIALMGA
jgi:hypothetical protein